MRSVKDYLEAADSVSTKRSYASAIRHFELGWKGLLPASSDAIAQYLSDYANTLSVSTLQLRLAGLARWHIEHGFADPTKAQVVRQVLRGIRTLHPSQQKQARPLLLDLLERVDQWLATAALRASEKEDRAAVLRHSRNRALLLLGFWRGFRSDELIRLKVEHVEVMHGEGMSLFLPRSKGDRMAEGRTVRCPALSRLCPVQAYETWLRVSGLTAGPVFRGVNRWGRIQSKGLAASSIIPLLRSILNEAGVGSVEQFSSHSLRRGFAGWANQSGWELKELMEYVGWRDMASALRYLDVTPERLTERFERGLSSPTEPIPPTRQKPRLQLVRTSKP